MSVVGAVVVFGGLAAWLTTTSSANFATTRGATGSLSTSSSYTCDLYGTAVKGVQKGTATLSSGSAGPVTITATPAITAVDTTKAFLLFTASSPGNGGAPGPIEIRGRISGATSLEFVRESAEASPVTVTVAWSVVEYECGVSVQRGSTAISALTTNVGISAVGSIARTFVTWSKTALNTENFWNNNDTAVAELTSTTNLQIRTVSAPPGHVVYWQVVEFTLPGAASVQRGVSTAFNDLSTTSSPIALGSAVDLSTSFVLVDAVSRADETNSAAKVVSGALTGTTTLTLRRGTATDVVDEIAWQVVSLADGSLVQRASPTTTSTSATTTFTPLDPARTSVITGTQFGGGQGGARILAAATNPAAGMPSLTTTATTVTLTRGTSAQNAVAEIQRIEWGGPSSTWSTAYGLRQRIGITATNTNGLPSGYSISFTFDHAAAVSSGFSLASGDDVRVARFDGTSWTQLDRVLSPSSAWNSSTTTVWFSTQAAVTASDNTTLATDGSYWLYYGNKSATGPPATAANVYLFADDFESGSLSNWSQIVGSGFFTVSTDRAHAGSKSLKFGTTASSWRELKAIATASGGMSVDAYWYLATPYTSDQVSMFARDATTSGTSIVGHTTGFANLGAGYGWNIASFNGGTSSFAEQKNAAGQSVTADAWQQITLQMQPATDTSTPNAIRVLRNGAALNPTSGWQSVTPVTASGTIGLASYVSSAGGVYVDDVTYRLLRVPEPSAALGQAARN